MDASWRMKLSVTPSSGEGFVIHLLALANEGHCRYELKRGSMWDLEPGDGLPQTASNEVPRAECDEVVQALLAASVPAAPLTVAAGLDGVTCSLTVAAGFNCIIYNWWCDLPDEWRVLQPAIDLLTRLAHRVA